MDESPVLMNGGFKTQELSQILQEHISKVATHYRGKVFAWDVVNEAFDEHGRVKPSIWYDQPGIGFAGKGTAYIEQTFRWAHAADPDALLFYNDGGGEAVNEKSDAIYAMVKDFRQRGVPIDGVGVQMHIFDLAPDVEGIDANIARFSALGVQIHITEMDVALPLDAYGSPRPADLSKQAEIYRRVASACLAHSGCTAIQTWGFTDKYSWIGSATKKTKGGGAAVRSELQSEGGLRGAAGSPQEQRKNAAGGICSFIEVTFSGGYNGVCPGFAVPAAAGTNT